jgi:hypothetical protein
VAEEKEEELAYEVHLYRGANATYFLEKYYAYSIR